ncbi:ABATE domain-containing protein, partial [Streptomyces sp. WELS2]|uniref:ABATE domain-containing protein n=1 Tax=Streptomyces sp. WELS2 TaxID=2749435 RepID=UPI0015F0FF65
MALGGGTPAYPLRFDAGRVCLDLLATRHPGERLDDVGALRAWIAGAGLVPDGTPLGHADGSWPVAF